MDDVVVDDLLSAHRALVAKVDAFEAGVRARRAGSMACEAGCSACCHAELSVCDVEADLAREGLARLDAEARARLAARVDAGDGRCVMLEDDGRCAIYSSRPLVCRTQGLALRYPDGVIPDAAIMARGKGERGGALTWCPLNFTGEDAPRAEDVLDAERVDAMLALSNRQHVARSGGGLARRTALRALAREITGELNEGKPLC